MNPYDNEELQKSIDIVIKCAVSSKHDEELGLTGRSIDQIICRMAQALEDRDQTITHLEAQLTLNDIDHPYN